MHPKLRPWDYESLWTEPVFRPTVGASLEADSICCSSASNSSFSSLSAYMGALMQTRKRLGHRAMAVWTPEEELAAAVARSGRCMERKLGWQDVVGLGVGGMLGAGVFVTTGSAANRQAGPAVILSFVLAGISALLSAFCYTEFAVELPAAGGAFSYLGISLGEFAAYLTGANLILEYVISNAAVARTFTSYMAAFSGYETDAWLIKLPGVAQGYNMLDFPAVGLVFALTICICSSTKRTSTFNMAITLLHLALILFIIVAGFINGALTNLFKPGNPLSPGGFCPFGVRGIFHGAAVVYMSFIGYDAVSTMAEEVKQPSKNMPIGISGSVVIVTVLYCLMAAAIAMLLPYDQIDPNAPFSLAFKKVNGWSWASNVVGGGACLGILTSLLVAMLGQARYLCAMGRSHLIPSWFAKVDQSSGTPIRSSVCLGLCTAIVALLIDLPMLMDLISLGTLFVFYMVANALIFRRYVLNGVTNPWPTIAFLTSATTFSAGFVLFWRAKGDFCKLGLEFCAGGFFVSAIAFWVLVPTVDRPKNWEAPCMPWLAALSIFVNVFLAGSLNKQAYVRFGVWSLLAILFYVGYSVHSTSDAQSGALPHFHHTEMLPHRAELLTTEDKNLDNP